jgi:hypothetical protein
MSDQPEQPVEPVLDASCFHRPEADPDRDYSKNPDFIADPAAGYPEGSLVGQILRARIAKKKSFVKDWQ